MGLSRQHLAEFELSGIQAELFMKEGRSLFAGRSVEIIDIHKLREESGEKTIAVEAFEGNNLVWWMKVTGAPAARKPANG